MKSFPTNRKQTAFFKIVSLMLAIAPLWLMLAATNTPAHAQTSNPSPGDWTQFLRDNMQRWNPYEMVLGVNNVGGLGLKWKNPIARYLNEDSSSPAVVNGVVYIGSEDDNVYALNASTGAKLWSFATGEGVVRSPAVANGVVYISSADRNVYALNASTGAKLWSFNTDEDFLEGAFPVANGVVYACTDNTALYALNASTGAKLWSSPGGQYHTSPAVANGVVYVAGNTLYALNASTGAKLWSYGTGGGGFPRLPLWMGWFTSLL
jgi:outer membrane protein assembly factor BamB